MEPEEDRAHRGREIELTTSTATEAIAMEPEEDRAHGGREDETDAWPERKRYVEAVEAEDIYMGIAMIEAPVLERDDLTITDLQHAWET
jgi:hypothetical protein